MEQPPAQRHIDFLDPIRGLAILLVFLFHSLAVAYNQAQLPWSGWFRDFASARFSLLLLPLTFGWVGVAIFFVVSGFCIHLSFFRHPQWSSFWQRRFFRIYPPYLVALLFFALLFPLTRLHFSSPLDAHQLLSHLGLFHNLGSRTFFGINGSFWSIAVEIQLYALYPVLIWLTTRFGWRRTMLGLAVLEVSLRLVEGILTTACGEGLPQRIGGSPFIFWCSWSSGAWVAERHLRGERGAISSHALSVLAASAILCNFFKPLASLSFLLFSLLTTAAIAQLLQKPENPFPLPGIIRNHLRRVGLWSFSLYLWHQPLLFALSLGIAATSVGAHFPPLLLFVICLTSWVILVPLARLSYRWCELPSIALGKLLSRQTQADF